MGNTASGESEGRVIALPGGAVPRTTTGTSDGIVTVQGSQRSVEECEGEPALVQLAAVLPLTLAVPAAPVGRTPLGCKAAPHEIDLRWILVLYRDYQTHVRRGVQAAERRQDALTEKLANGEYAVRRARDAFAAHADEMGRGSAALLAVPRLCEHAATLNRRVRAALGAVDALTRALASVEIALQDLEQQQHQQQR